jgi:hypothetical protein
MIAAGGLTSDPSEEHRVLDGSGSAVAVLQDHATISDVVELPAVRARRCRGAWFCRRHALALTILVLSCRIRPASDSAVERTDSAASKPMPEEGASGRAPTVGCAELRARAASVAKQSAQCKSDAECCLIWDTYGDCLAANRSSDIKALRDTARRLVRECRQESRGCEGKVPVCRTGHCAWATRQEPGGGVDDDCTLFGFRYGCPQPYEPAVPKLPVDAEKVVLLAGRKVDMVSVGYRPSD